MGCRCQERREAIKHAAQFKTVKEAVKTARFVARTMAEDAGRALVRRRTDPAKR